MTNGVMALLIWSIVGACIFSACFVEEVVPESTVWGLIFFVAIGPLMWVICALFLVYVVTVDWWAKRKRKKGKQESGACPREKTETQQIGE
jgi:phosphate/sulfate permease